jgi:hypothetical protein
MIKEIEAAQRWQILLGDVPASQELSPPVGFVDRHLQI